MGRSSISLGFLFAACSLVYESVNAVSKMASRLMIPADTVPQPKTKISRRHGPACARRVMVNEPPVGLGLLTEPCCPSLASHPPNPSRSEATHDTPSHIRLAWAIPCAVVSWCGLCGVQVQLQHLPRCWCGAASAEAPVVWMPQFLVDLHDVLQRVSLLREQSAPIGAECGGGCCECGRSAAAGSRSVLLLLILIKSTSTRSFLLF